MKKNVKCSAVIIMALSVIVFAASAQAQQAVSLEGAELLPPNAKAGECYARVFVPPTYKTVTEMALKKEKAEELIIRAPQFEIVEERIMTKGPSERHEIIPAEYEWVEEQLLIRPEHKRLKSTPARYETVTEKVIDQPAHTVWKKGKGPIQRIDYGTGEIMCLVEVPATYKTVSRRVLAEPARTIEIITPAEYITTKKHIMKTPPTVRKIEIPAEYKMVKTRQLKSEALVEIIAIEEEFQPVSRRELLTEGRMAWRPILCETNVRPGVVLSLQKALKEAGYNPGPIDGDIGRQTMAAVQSFQRDKGIPTGELTIETLKSLNIDF